MRPAAVTSWDRRAKSLPRPIGGVGRPGRVRVAEAIPAVPPDRGGSRTTITWQTLGSRTRTNDPLRRRLAADTQVSLAGRDRVPARWLVHRVWAMSARE